MITDNKEKTRISILDKAIFAVLLTTCIVLLIMVMFPNAGSFTLQVIKSPRQTLDPEASPTGNYLKNGNMNAGFYNISLTSKDITGSVADEWSTTTTTDNMKVRYDRETVDSHLGTSCQKVSIQPSENNGDVQFQQTRYLPSGYYKGSIWMRADTNVPVFIAVYGGDQQFIVKKLIRTQWQKVEFSGNVVNWGLCPVVISIKRPGTIWIADANLHRVSGGIAGVILAFIGYVIITTLVIFIIRYILRNQSFQSTLRNFCKRPKWLLKSQHNIR